MKTQSDWSISKSLSYGVYKVSESDDEDENEFDHDHGHEVHGESSDNQ